MRPYLFFALVLLTALSGCVAKRDLNRQPNSSPHCYYGLEPWIDLTRGGGGLGQLGKKYRLCLAGETFVCDAESDARESEGGWRADGEQQKAFDPKKTRVHYQECESQRLYRITNTGNARSEPQIFVNSVKGPRCAELVVPKGTIRSASAFEKLCALKFGKGSGFTGASIEDEGEEEGEEDASSAQ
jgi:hypothetical protein